MALQKVRDEVITPERRGLYRQAVWISIAGNSTLAFMKGTAAWLSGSSAMYSDAANSLSDLLYSVLMALGLCLSQRPADEGHPQGHSRFEPIVGLLIGAAMAAAGIAAIAEAIGRLTRDARQITLGWATAALILSTLLKLAMYFAVRRIGRRTLSPAIEASAQDNLSDVLTSAAALLGIWSSRLVHPLLDPIVGIVVALWIFRAAWEIVWENLGYLTGRGISTRLTNEIITAASSVPGVLGVHQVIADHVGPQIRVDLHIDVDGQMTVTQCHTITDQVQTTVEALPTVDLAFVHVEPIRVKAE
ncbi:MAG: cation transporter [Chloroflexi bacterium]|nr:cation transporter [Chloroflexota bacterium]